MRFIKSNNPIIEYAAKCKKNILNQEVLDLFDKDKLKENYYMNRTDYEDDFYYRVSGGI
jgi:hypothetical protein